MTTSSAVTPAATQRGVTLIELIVFIVIMGISVTALLSMYRAVLPHGATPSQITLATQFAQERMELILGQRVAVGYAAAADPCVGGIQPICTDQFTPSGLYSVIAVGSPVAVTWPVNPSLTTFRMVGVKVLGPDGNQLANLSAVIANY